MLKSKSAEETRSIGARLARQLQSGDVVLLDGGLGAGKSELARGIIRELGFPGPVTSPTFTLMNLYETSKGPLHHFDWYRIEDPEELVLAGLDEFIGGDSITQIEWSERARDLVPETHLLLTIRVAGEHERELDFQSNGAFRPLDMNALKGGRP